MPNRIKFQRPCHHATHPWSMAEEKDSDYQICVRLPLGLNIAPKVLHAATVVGEEGEIYQIIASQMG